MSRSILETRHDTWVEIALNRPERMNAFTAQMHVELAEALEKATTRGDRAVLLTGTGRGFCAGQDLGERNPAAMDAPPDLGETVRTYWAPLVRRIKALDCPVICAVNGVAAGAGSSLALACDIVLAASSARFIQSFGKVGLIPDTGGSWHLPHLVGPARAKGLSLLCEPLSAAQAEDWGLIWRALPDEDLMPTAREMAARLAQGPTLGFAETKKAIDLAATQDLDAHLEYEAQAMARCGRSQDYAEGVTAFLNKRPPVFKGK
jgi:2-(1,2-epoxy-1,2-dihydrophenyl)acetyl-CoA isomerase